MFRKKAHCLARVIVSCALVNVAVIIIFYMWVLASQHPTLQQRDHHVIHHHAPNLGEQRNGSPNKSSPEVPKKPPGTFNASLVVKPQIINDQQPVLPPVPAFSKDDFVPPLNDAILKEYQKYSPREARETVVILTPIHNVAGTLQSTYLHLLQSINYPHRLISVAFGEDGSSDHTLPVAEEVAEELRKSFSSVDVFHFNLTGQIEGSWSVIHERENQYKRRQHLAQSRNLLLKAGLKNQDWVLWIDADVTYFPPDVIQQLLSAQKDVVTPACLFEDSGAKNLKRVYDKNTWRETSFSLDHLKRLSPQDLVLEGYADTQRLWLTDLRAEGKIVPIDGVGGCMLLVKGDCHRQGLIFPETVFQHHIETEGLAKLAKSMGYGVFGMPFVEVLH